MVDRFVAHDEDLCRCAPPIVCGLMFWRAVGVSGLIVGRRLGLPTLRTLTSTFADGRRGQLAVAGPVSIQIGDRRMLTECIVVPEGAEALVGQVVMGMLDLIPDPVNQTLGPRPESPDRPLLRV